MARARRTLCHRTAGRKLYAVRVSKWRFEDVQTCGGAHRADLAKKSKAE